MISMKIMPLGPVPDRSSGVEVSEKRSAGFAGSLAIQWLALLLSLTSLFGCTEKPNGSQSNLDRVKQSGQLRVATRFGSSRFYERAQGPAGLEHDLAQLFARQLGIEIQFVVRDSAASVVEAVVAGQADLAAGLMVDPKWQDQLRFGPPYRRITEQLLYNTERPAPGSLADLGQGLIEVPAGSGHLATLERLRRQHAGLSWHIVERQAPGDLAYRVNVGTAKFTVADSDRALLMRRYYPKLGVAFDIDGRRELAWGVPLSGDSSLHVEVARFFGRIRRDKTLDQLIDRYYGHAQAFDPALDRNLRQDCRRLLPRFKPLFVRSARAHRLDWRLLAAIAYQESQWKSGAVSTEGVRGMMMLTGDTAKELKVQDRFDPAQSIAGGASYLKQTLDQMPANIQNPDRTWYALAAYNLGPGHVEDARKLVRTRGGDPDKWIEIKRVLPLLAKPAWYRKTRYGKARGAVAVHYVNSIRRFYDLLVWITEQEGNRRLAPGFGQMQPEGV